MKRRGIALACVALGLLFLPATASGVDQDKVRRAFESGQVVGLPKILSRVRASYQGRVLEIELEQLDLPNRQKPWVYGIRVLTPQGNVLHLELDAQTTRILNVTGRGADAARKKR